MSKIPAHGMRARAIDPLSGEVIQRGSDARNLEGWKRQRADNLKRKGNNSNNVGVLLQAAIAENVTIKTR